jgi:hypothetical protein
MKSSILNLSHLLQQNFGELIPEEKIELRIAAMHVGRILGI